LTPGRLARRVLGPLFPASAGLYRRVFVDMERVASWIAERLPKDARVLDVGGGDGYLVNCLLRQRPDIVVTMTDIADDIGRLVCASFHGRVIFRSATDISVISEPHDVRLLSDVLHHVPAQVRPIFLSRVGAAAERIGCDRIIIKDIEPKGLRSRLSLLADHYVTGDKEVSLISAAGVEVEGFRKVLVETPDFPNYCALFDRQ